MRGGHVRPEWLVGFAQLFRHLRMLFGDIIALRGIGLDVVEKLVAMVHQTPAFGEHHRMRKGLWRQGVSACGAVELHEVMCSGPWLVGAGQQRLE